MNQGWQKILDIVKKTGERCFVVDSEDQEVYAILKLADYEKLVSPKVEVAELTEDELLNRINSDIELWQANQNEDEGGDGPLGATTADAGKSRDDRAKEEKEEEFYIEPIETN